MIRVIALVSVLSLATAAALLQSAVGNPVAALHLAFALGIVPLIFTAILHFVPVLTRSGEPHRAASSLPIWAQIAGLLTVAAMQGWLSRSILPFAAAVDFGAAVLLALWVCHRARRCIGPAHPGWRWYLASLSVFMLALLAIAAGVMWPETYRIARLMHLHLNPLGFVGLSAFGTLPLLLPTAVRKADAGAAPWLRRMLWPAVAATLLIAFGGASNHLLAGVGGLLWGYCLCRLLWHWRSAYGVGKLLQDGVTASLLTAVCGACVIIAAGFAHGVAGLAAGDIVAAWFCGFLLPLVTGALAQLLPVWRWPGPQRPGRHAMRQCLARTGTLRAACFFIAAIVCLAGNPALGKLFGLAGLLLFIGALILSVRITPATR